MLSRSDVYKEAIEKFRVAKAMTIKELTVLFNCSVRTVHRRLKELHVVNSFNCNGRFYALGDVPDYNSIGIWHFNGISFSKFGSLTETVVTLIKKSEAGLSAAEIGELVKLNPHSFIWTISQRLTVRREKVKGRFVYFSANDAVGERQCLNRQREKSSLTASLPPDNVGILILVERIKNPMITSETLSRRLQQQGMTVTVSSIGHFFDYHGLLKKTSNSVTW